MAIALASKYHTDNTDADYPFGKIKDDPGDGSGSRVNKESLGDFHQFFAKMLSAAGITANGLPDNDPNGYQYYLAMAKLAVLGYPMGSGGEWISAGTLSVSALGTFTVTGGDVIYNKYKIIGKTLFWQIQIRTATIGGAPTALLIDIPAALSALSYANSLGIQPAGVYNSTELLFVTINGGSGSNQLRLNRAANAPFTNGTNDQNIDINVVVEVA